MDIFEKDTAYVAHTYARFPVALVKGEGSLLTDVNGKTYIDMGSGIAVNTFGAADPGWTAAVTAQLHTLQHTSNLYYTSPCAQLAELLCQRTGMKKVFFGNSGAEANECAIKAARKYAADKKGPDCYKILTLRNSFHGRTLATLAATGQETFHKDFLPLPEGFVTIDPTPEALFAAIDEHTAAVLFEAVRGEGGVLPMEPAFAEALKALAAEKDILLIADEVQCGCGRTGKLCGYMHFGLEPDIVTMAKGLGGGLPLGACLLGRKTENVFTPGLHGSTFGGNPVCCAGGVEILSRLDEALLAEVTAKGAKIRSLLAGAPGIKSVTGLGLMLGIETELPAAKVVAACMEQGVLVLTAKNKVRLLPPLNTPEALLEKAITVIKNVCGGNA